MPRYSRRPIHPTSISRNFSERFSIFEQSHKGKKPCPCGIPQGTSPCGKRNASLSVGELSEEFWDIYTVIWRNIQTECISVVPGRERYLYHGKQGLTPGGHHACFSQCNLFKIYKKHSISHTRCIILRDANSGLPLHNLSSPPLSCTGLTTVITYSLFRPTISFLQNLIITPQKSPSISF